MTSDPINSYTGSHVSCHSNIPRSNRSIKAILCTVAAGLALPMAPAGESPHQGTSAEINRRTEAILLAEEQLLLGDQKFQAGEREEALNLYRQALAGLPNAPVADDRRTAIQDRIATSAISLAKDARKSGDYQRAQDLLELVLSPEVQPTNKEALIELERLADPERSNPALSPAHVENTAQVKALLIKAEGQIELGLFAEAKQTCEELLRIDPYNRAARRMMESSEKEITVYHASSYDQMRAKLLNDVAQAWEQKVNPVGQVIAAGQGGQGAASDPSLDMEARLRNTIIPELKLSGERLDDVLSFLEQAVNEQNPGSRPFNVVFELGPVTESPAREILDTPITLSLSQVPALEIINYVCQQTGTVYRFDAFAMRIQPANSDRAALVTRQFKVPADFLTQSAGQEDSSDPFAEDDGRTRLTSRISAREYLEKNGVQFPSGASAQHNSFNNTLYVRNTEGNMRMVEAIIDSLRRETPIQVVFTTTFVEVNSNDLEELGYDWLLDGGQAGSEFFVNGGSPPSDTGVSSQISPLGPGTGPGNAITSGLRSGDSMFTPDVLNNRLASGREVGFDSSLRAPGVLGFRGVFSDADFMTVLRGLSQLNGSDVLLRPSIIAKPGETASLYVGEEFIYPTEYDPPELPNAAGGGQGGSFPVTPANPTAFETRNLGITLEVEPIVSAGSKIVELRIAPEFTDFIGFINYGTPIIANENDALGNPITLTLTENQILQPIFRTRRINTSATIADGHTIVIGGLKRESRHLVNDEVPILADIPLVGRFFKSEGIRRQQRSVLIFVKARIIDPGGSSIHSNSPTQ